MTMQTPSRVPSTAAPEDQFVVVNGLRLHYLDWGGAAAQPLVCLHGMTGNARTWDTFIQDIRADYHVYALEQRGHGDSDYPADGDYGTSAFVPDLVGFLDALKLEQVIVVGHSMGAHNTMALAARHPSRVSKIVLVDLAPMLDRSGPRPAQPTEFDSVDEVVQLRQEVNPQTPVEELQRIAAASVKRLPNGKLGLKVDPRAGDNWKPEDLWDEVGSIRVPALIIRGSITQIFPRGDADRMVQVFPNARLVEFEGAGHSIHNDQPATFTATVVGFLNS